MRAHCRGSIPRQRRIWLWRKTPCNHWEPWTHSCGQQPLAAKWRPCPWPRARRGCCCGDGKIPLLHWRPVRRHYLKNAILLPMPQGAARLARPPRVVVATYCAVSTGSAAMPHPARGRTLPVSAHAGWPSASCAKCFSLVRLPLLAACNRSKKLSTACSARPLPRPQTLGGL